MKRRHWIAAMAGVGALSACQPNRQGGPGEATRISRQWKMVTSWPPNFPGLGTAATRLADLITKASDGQLTVKIYGANELVPAFEVFDAVSRGTAEMGHSGAYYWKGKHEATPFFCSVPFGLNAQEMNGWLYHGGGLELWREVYAPFNLVPFPAGNTGAQMAGWFKREIKSLKDLKGLKMRIPGVGGEVWRRIGGAPVNIPGGELFTALDSGAIDAAEWVGPYNDLAFGLHKAAKYYYYPGWQEPGPTLECLINRNAWESLPMHLQAIVEACCRAINDDMLAEYTAQNHRALATLVDEHKVEVRRLPGDVLAALRRAADEVLEEMAQGNPLVAKVHQSYVSFREQARAWHRISEQAYYETRD